MTRYTQHVSPKKTSQSEQARNDQKKNNAGGYTFTLGPWERLERWLILGAEGGTYYASEKTITKENAKTVKECLKLDGAKTVEKIVEVSKTGRAPKNEPAIFALAFAAADENERTRRLALAAIESVCRTGTHLFQFAEAVNELRGWGRGLRNAVGDWYNNKDADAVAYQLIKYQNRNGWSHRDLLRLVHVTPTDAAHAAAYRYVVAGTDFSSRKVNRDIKGKAVATSYKAVSTKHLPGIIDAYEQMKVAKTTGRS